MKKNYLFLSIISLLALSACNDSGGTSSSLTSSSNDSSNNSSSSSSSDTSLNSEDLSGLTTAITNMGHNYTAKAYYGDNDLYYTLYCTEDGIYSKYSTEWGSSGFIFKDDGLAYYFHLTDGLANIDEEPYKWMDGDTYTRDFVYSRDYPVSTIVAEYFEKTAEGVYSCKEDYLYTMGRAIVSESDPAEIKINVADGYITNIEVNDFTDPDFGGTDSVNLTFENVGQTSIEEFLVTERPPFESQLPSPTDPSKPQAPSTYESAGDKPIDTVNPSVYVNGESDDTLSELKTAIDNAREKN